MFVSGLDVPYINLYLTVEMLVSVEYNSVRIKPRKRRRAPSSRIVVVHLILSSFPNVFRS